MLEPEVFRKQMYCIEETTTCDIVRTFRRLPQWFGARVTVSPCPPRYALVISFSQLSHRCNYCAFVGILY